MNIENITQEKLDRVKERIDLDRIAREHARLCYEYELKQSHQKITIGLLLGFSAIAAVIALVLIGFIN